MEWPCVGTPVDWMNEFDFKLIKESNGNFVRPMHIVPKPIQVSAADKFGVVMVVPAANNEGDSKEPDIWQERRTSCAMLPFITATARACFSTRAATRSSPRST